MSWLLIPLMFPKQNTTDAATSDLWRPKAEACLLSRCNLTVTLICKNAYLMKALPFNNDMYLFSANRSVANDMDAFISSNNFQCIPSFSSNDSQRAHTHTRTQCTFSRFSSAGIYPWKTKQHWKRTGRLCPWKCQQTAETSPDVCATKTFSVSERL